MAVDGFPAGRIVAGNVSETDFMQQYAETFHEWINGFVIKLPPITIQHDEISGYLLLLFKAYFALRPIGVVRMEPFIMRLDLQDRRTIREPDLQIILNENQHTLHETY